MTCSPQPPAQCGRRSTPAGTAENAEQLPPTAPSVGYGVSAEGAGPKQFSCFLLHLAKAWFEKRMFGAVPLPTPTHSAVVLCQAWQPENTGASNHPTWAYSQGGGSTAGQASRETKGHSPTQLLCQKSEVSLKEKQVTVPSPSSRAISEFCLGGQEGCKNRMFWSFL